MGITPSILKVGTPFQSLEDMNLQHTIHMMVMPSFYNKDILREEERIAAVEAWNLIISNATPIPVECSTKFTNISSVEYFYQSFMYRLNDFHPLVGELIKRSGDSHNKNFAPAITYIVNNFNSIRLISKLKKLGDIHNKLGVKTIECKNLSRVSICFLTYYCLCRWYGSRRIAIYVTPLLW